MYAKQWCENVRQWTQKGKSIQRVRLINEDRGAYFNFEVEACYPHNVQVGEEIYMLEEKVFDTKFDIAKSDVWILDETRVLDMEYADNGEFVDCYLSDDPKNYLANAKDDLIDAATRFGNYLQTRRQCKI